MKTITRLIFALVLASLTGCVSFNYGSGFTRPPPQDDVATVVLYRHDTATLAPAGGGQLPYEIDGVLADEPLNPHSFKVVRVTPGKRVFNARTGVIDLRREALLEAGKVYFAKASCYYVVTEAFCKIEVVPEAVALSEISGLRESNGVAG